ncbi:hypothetical protein [Ferrimicrobium acidiphilum]|uniref:hypothetical protein n=1 Tax=Ferrimicrobium acidiphilum TaxID=121039 RepID=UPI0023F4E8E8|nr:hypothetical protein [Ferrimicrobium acidiphilum]
MRLIQLVLLGLYLRAATLIQEFHFSIDHKSHIPLLESNGYPSRWDDFSSEDIRAPSILPSFHFPVIWTQSGSFVWKGLSSGRNVTIC